MIDVSGSLLLYSLYGLIYHKRCGHDFCSYVLHICRSISIICAWLLFMCAS
jgi:uncharacterized UPF0146 family protein